MLRSSILVVALVTSCNQPSTQHELAVNDGQARNSNCSKLQACKANQFAKRVVDSVEKLFRLSKESRAVYVNVRSYVQIAHTLRGDIMTLNAMPKIMDQVKELAKLQQALNKMDLRGVKKSRQIKAQIDELSKNFDRLQADMKVRRKILSQLRETNRKMGTGGFKGDMYVNGESFKGSVGRPNIDADGQPDYVFRRKFRGDRHSHYFLSLNQNQKFGMPVHVGTHGGGYTHLQSRFADVNGDGLDDMIFRGLPGPPRNLSQYHISLSNGLGFQNSIPSITHGGKFVIGQSHYARVNRDKRYDLVFQGNDGQIYTSLSKPRKDRKEIFDSPRTTVKIPYPIRLEDYNNDGLADILYTDDRNRRFVAYSAGDNFKQPERRR